MTFPDGFHQSSTQSDDDQAKLKLIQHKRDVIRNITRGQSAGPEVAVSASSSRTPCEDIDRIGPNSRPLQVPDSESTSATQQKPNVLLGRPFNSTQPKSTHWMGFEELRARAQAT
jgi:hypothetical protein